MLTWKDVFVAEEKRNDDLLWAEQARMLLLESSSARNC